jgi:hypothetical protein
MLYFFWTITQNLRRLSDSLPHHVTVRINSRFTEPVKCLTVISFTSFRIYLFATCGNAVVTLALVSISLRVIGVLHILYFAVNIFPLPRGR